MGWRAGLSGSPKSVAQVFWHHWLNHPFFVHVSEMPLGFTICFNKWQSKMFWFLLSTNPCSLQQCWWWEKMINNLNIHQ